MIAKQESTASSDVAVTSTKTGDTTPIAIYVIIAVAAMGVIVFAKRRIRA